MRANGLVRAGAGLGPQASGPVEVIALGQHGGLQVLVLLLLPQPLLLQEGHQGVALLHHLQHLAQDAFLLRQLPLRLQVVWVPPGEGGRATGTEIIVRRRKKKEEEVRRKREKEEEEEVVRRSSKKEEEEEEEVEEGGRRRR